ncbi:MAG: hypothetical protein AB9834_09030 [Lentimicrobium sp.]
MIKRTTIRRGFVEFILFFLTGASIVLLIAYGKGDYHAPEALVDTRNSIPVFTMDTAILYHTNHRAVGKLYPSGGVVYVQRPFSIDSSRIHVRIYGWIYYKCIFNLGEEWLLINDENIRVKNNCIKIGRLAKQTRIQRIYSPEDREWNFFSLDCYVRIQSLQSYVYSRYQPIFSDRWPYVVTTDLTTEGSKTPPGRRLMDPITLPGFFTIFQMLIMIGILWLYFRHTGRMQCRDRWVLLVIDVAGFMVGVGVQGMLINA